MPITPLSGSGGIDELWGDFSGGTIVLAFQHPTYTGQHGLRVWNFSTDGLGTFTAGGPGGTTTLQQEADNLVSLLAACYAADTTISAIFARQTTTDHKSEVPYPYQFTAPASLAGTAGGSSNPVPDVINLVSRGGDGSRWALQLPGFSSLVSSTASNKVGFAATTGAVNALVKYLCGQTNGPVHGVKTNVVTHNGVAISFSVGNAIQQMNKRLRRHFKFI